MATFVYQKLLLLLWVLFFRNPSTFVFFILVYYISVFFIFTLFSLYPQLMVFLDNDLHVFTVVFSTDQPADTEGGGGVSANAQTHVSQKNNFVSLEKDESSFDETGSLREGAKMQDMQKVAEKYNAAVASAELLTDQMADALPEKYRPMGGALIKSNSFRSSLTESLATHVDPSQPISPSHKYLNPHNSFN